MKGSATEDDVLKALRTARFKSVQYSFHTARSLKFLKLKEVLHEQ